MKRLLFFILLCNSLFCFQLQASTESQVNRRSESMRLVQFAEWLDSLEQEKRLSGSFLFARDGKVVFNKSVGRVHPDRPEKITEDSSINIGSVSKQFTAAAIMILKQQGKLTYDDLVTKHIANFPYSNITIRHLLQHTSGLNDYEELTDTHWSKLKFTNQDMVELYVKFKPELEFQPNSRFEYSNTGYVLLAAIVEAISGQSLEDFSDKYIFKPLGMHNTRVFTMFSADQVFTNRVYGQEDGELFDQYHIEGVTGDGGVYSTPTDLMKWHLALMSGSPVSRSEINQAFTPLTLNNGVTANYGFGWMVSDNLKGLQAHTGSWLSFTSLFTRNENTNEVLLFITSQRDDLGYKELRDNFINAVDAELIYTKAGFTLCSTQASPIECN